MCELCVVPPKQPANQRHKLWEIRPDLHCTILGTCLSYADLLKIGRKAGFVQSETATEYEVHNCFVHRAEEPERLARLMHKALDAKYRAAIHACQQAQCAADLEEFWSDALAKGDIPGPYWALMTNPLTTEALLVRAFGEVHMLSHLTGAANRADVRRLRGTEAALADANRRLTAQATEHRRGRGAECRPGGGTGAPASCGRGGRRVPGSRRSPAQRIRERRCLPCPGAC